MKKAFFFILAIFISMSAFAGTFSFKTLSIYVPDNWSCSKDVDAATLSSPNKSVIVRITSFPTEGYSLSSLAEAMSGQVKGTSPVLNGKIATYSYQNQGEAKTTVSISQKGPMVIMVFVTDGSQDKYSSDVKKILDSVL